jgi:3-deoxy-D-manno-octulosonic acid (KDO) 8-phosphate synthase
LLGLRCEGEEMAMRIAEKLVGITDAKIPFVFKGSFKKQQIALELTSQVHRRRKST